MAIPKFEETQLEEICNVLADTTHGLTGSEIGRLLARVGAPDPLPSSTKRVRLYEALSAKQRKDASGNNVSAFIQEAMNPVRYRDATEVFEERRQALNIVLAFSGYELGEDGKLKKREPVKTLAEAENRARRLRSELSKRGVHADVLRFCQAELLQDNFFHAVFEATKSVADKIRQKSGLQSDGTELVDMAFGLGKTGIPILAFNTLQTQTEKSEHTGLMNLMKGMFGAFRNVTAHAPKITWAIGEQDALDLMSLASLLHRRLDAAVPTNAARK